MEKAIQTLDLPAPAAHRPAPLPGPADVQSIRWRDLLAGPAPLATLCGRALAEQRWFIAAALLYLLVGFVLAAAYGQRITLWMYSDIHLILYGYFILAIVIGRIARQLYRHRPAHPIRFVWEDLIREVFIPWRMISATAAFFLVPFVLSMSSSLKKMIPLIAPFSWDAPLAEADRLLHGGYHPWELMQPILGEPIVTYAFSLTYTLPWYAMVVVLQFWMTFSIDPGRMRFLLTYVLCWSVLGTGMAIAFSSAGPVFYGHVVAGSNPFAALVTYLNDVGQVYELPSLMAQAYLWESYEKDFLRFGNGISAMPSMHLSMAFFIVLASWRLHWSGRLVAIAYLVVLLVGSVHLASHYAIDAYISILATGLIFLTVTRAEGWRDSGMTLRQGVRAARAQDLDAGV